MGPAEKNSQANNRSSKRLRPRRRLRARHELRHNHSLRNGQVRPARDQHRNNARGGRHPAVNPSNRQVQGHGDDSHRTANYRQEAEKHGLVNRVVPVEAYFEDAKKLAMQIAQKAPVAVRLAKEAVLKAFDTPLEEGLQYERRNFYLLFSTEDMKEGMTAFTEKRPPHFKGR